MAMLITRKNISTLSGPRKNSLFLEQQCEKEEELYFRRVSPWCLAASVQARTSHFSQIAQLNRVDGSLEGVIWVTLKGKGVKKMEGPAA